MFTTNEKVSLPWYTFCAGIVTLTTFFTSLPAIRSAITLPICSGVSVQVKAAADSAAVASKL